MIYGPGLKATRLIYNWKRKPTESARCALID